MDKTAFDSANADFATWAPDDKEIAESSRGWDWRTTYDSANSDRKVTSDKITMVKDKYYYMSLTHAEAGGADYMTVSVEFTEDAPVEKHPNRKRAEQTYEITNPGDLETWTISITKWDTDKKFKVNFKNPFDDDKV